MNNLFPIGIIQSTGGGTPVQAWTSREMQLTSSATREKMLAGDTLTQNNVVKDSLDMIRFWDIVYHPQNNTDKTVPLPDYDDSDWTAVEIPRLIKDFGIREYEGMHQITYPNSYKLRGR